MVKAQISLLLAVWMLVIATRTYAASASIPHAVPARHLYVMDYAGASYGGHAIWRFPLERDGMPTSTPDLTLDGGLQEPYGMALDLDGNLFVSDVGPHAVFEYAFGAQGNAHPIRELSFGSGAPFNVGVDRFDRLYVDEGFQNSVELFRRGAHGNEPPIHIINNWGGQGFAVDDVFVDHLGALFVSVSGKGVFVYANPFTRWQQPTYIVLESLALDYYIPGYDSIAVDEGRNAIYVPFYTVIQQPWGREDYDKLSLSQGSGAGAANELMFTRTCKGGGIASSVISGNYLLASCNGYPQSVLVYYKNVFGRQPLLKKIGKFISPGVIRIGP